MQSVSWTKAEIRDTIIFSTLQSPKTTLSTHKTRRLCMTTTTPLSGFPISLKTTMEAWTNFGYHFSGEFNYPQDFFVKSATLISHKCRESNVFINELLKSCFHAILSYTFLYFFRNWLVRLQNAFDNDLSSGNIYEYGWHPNASSDGILAYKLLVQTGHVDYPVDETLLLRNR